MTGGSNGSYVLSSTEIYVLSAWSYATSLPSPRYSLSATTVANSVFVFGKFFSFNKFRLVIVNHYTGGQDENGNYLDEVQQYDPAEETWTEAGNMKTPRKDHSVMLLSDVSAFCS